MFGGSNGITGKYTIKSSPIRLVKKIELDPSWVATFLVLSASSTFLLTGANPSDLRRRVEIYCGRPAGTGLPIESSAYCG
jgi:hypothetical protein